MSALARRIVVRVGQAIPVLFIVAVAVFALLEVSEGDAVDAYLAETGAAGDDAFIAALRERYDLADSLPGRFAAYLTRLVTLDLGPSIAFGRPVVEVIGERLPTTLLLMGLALILASLVGSALGAVAALRRGHVSDGVITSLALVLNATPGFLVGLVALIVFAVSLRWLPLGGLATFGRESGGLDGVLDTARHLVLPVMTLTLTYLALYVRLMRSAVVETTSALWVTAARARGVRGRRLLLRHKVRPALAPVVTMVGIQAGAMLGGSVVVETVFAIPGLGSLAYGAVAQRDLLLLAGILLTGAVMVMVANLIVDILYGVIDPRIRLGAGTVDKVS